LGSDANVIKLFTIESYEFRKKLEFLSLASLSSLVYFLWARPGAYPKAEHLKGSSIGQAPALPTNIRLGWRVLQVTNTITYCEDL
jgi:hypothetical protein